MQRKITKAERRLIAVSASAITLLSGMAFWRVSINAEPQVVIPAYPKAPNLNGFDVYIKAAKMIVPANPAVDRINDSNAPIDEKAQAKKYSLQKKEAWLKQNAAGFAMFQKALAIPCVAPPFDDSEDSPVFYAKLRELARSKYIESSTRALRGEWNGAMQSRLDIVQMGSDTARGGVLISALVGMATQAIGRGNIGAGVENLDATQTRRAVKRLERLYASRLSLDDALRAEKSFGLSATLKHMRDPQWRSAEKWAEINLASVEDLTWKDRLWMRTVSKKAVIENYSQNMNAMIANARLPYAAPQKPLPLANNPFNRDHVGTMNIRWAFARNDAANAMWLVALALHAHKLEQKSYPQELRVLVPRYLKEIPADPFGGGESLRYKREGNSYILWSIGPDKIGSDGKPIPPNKAFSELDKGKLPRIQPESKGDYIWGKNQ